MILPALTKACSSALILVAILTCSSSEQKIQLPYWVPASFPCRSLVVGSEDSSMRIRNELVNPTTHTQMTHDDKIITGTNKHTETESYTTIPVLTMKHEKELDEVLKMFIGLCKFHVQDFNVRRCSRTHLAVGRILHGIRIGTHEPYGRRGNRIRKSLLKVLDNVFFCAPIATGNVCMCRCARMCL